MEKPNSAALHREVQSARDAIISYLTELLKGTSEEQPYVCCFPVGYWCSFGLSSLDLPWINAMYYDEDFETIYARFDGNDGWTTLTECPVEDLLEILEGID